MNTLIQTVRTSLLELDAGMKGTLNISDAMEELSGCIFLGKQPERWIKVAYGSLKDLLLWYDDLLLRVAQLAEYSEELVAPKSLWISGLFNPMSYLTAIKQYTARSKRLALDDMGFRTQITNWFDPAEVPEKAEEGAYIHGFTVQGAAWEKGRGADEGNLMEMIPKELTPDLPVMLVTAVLVEEQIALGYQLDLGVCTSSAFYRCPTYVTSARGPGNFVTTVYLKLESDEADPRKWVLAGCALIMQPE
jgi:dynein heavy chain